MANYGRGWNDGYGAQSAEAVEAYQERCELEAVSPSVKEEKPYDFVADLNRRLAAELKKMSEETGLSEDEIINRAIEVFTSSSKE